MYSYVFKLEGPMQSWGTQSRFFNRGTGKEPSKSGVIGFLCVALGRSQDEDITDLGNLKMGIRVEREGILLKDYHTTSDTVKASGGKNPFAVITNREYLADACFLVFLEGDREILEKIDKALHNPVWQLFLGRKSFPLTSPPVLNLPLEERLVEKSLVEFMKDIPWQSTPKKKQVISSLRTIVEKDMASEDSNKSLISYRQDQPLGTSYKSREFAKRKIEIGFIPIDILPKVEE